MDPGQRPELAWLPIGKLTVDHTYQRTLESRRSQALIERIAAEFRWFAFQAILATPNGTGGWLVLDGQHRVEAARRCGVEHVPAVVVQAATVEEQARAFVRANLDRVAVNPFALYHARLVAGEEKAKAIAAVCRACKVTIPKYSQTVDYMKPGETLALGVIAQMVDKVGEKSAREILGCVAGAYREVPGGVRAPMLRAVWRLYGEAPESERKKLLDGIAAYLCTITPTALASKAMQRKEQYGGTEYANLAAVIKLGAGAAARATATPLATSSIKPPTRAQLMGGR